MPLLRWKILNIAKTCHSREQASFETFQHLWIPLPQQLPKHYLFPIASGAGPSGEFVGGMAKTVILSITSSLFLALYIVPVLLNYLDQIKFLKKKFWW